MTSVILSWRLRHQRRVELRGGFLRHPLIQARTRYGALRSQVPLRVEGPAGEPAVGLVAEARNSLRPVLDELSRAQSRVVDQPSPAGSCGDSTDSTDTKEPSALAVRVFRQRCQMCLLLRGVVREKPLFLEPFDGALD